MTKNLPDIFHIQNNRGRHIFDDIYYKGLVAAPCSIKERRHFDSVAFVSIKKAIEEATALQPGESGLLCIKEDKAAFLKSKHPDKMPPTESYYPLNYSLGKYQKGG